LQAFDALVSELSNGLTGKPRQVAQARKEEWQMSSTYWEFIAKLIKALEVRVIIIIIIIFFCQTPEILQVLRLTLEFSKKKVPTICKVLPLYKLLEVTLTEQATQLKEDEPTLSTALLAGAALAIRYISKALFGD
jgi:hypothetical protein